MLRLTYLAAFILSVWSSGWLEPHAHANDAGTPEVEGQREQSETNTAQRPYTPRPSEFGKKKRDLDMHALKGATVLRVPIEGTIDLGLAALIKRVFAEHGDAGLIVLDINTLGGRVDAAIQIRDALLTSKAKTVAFVHPRAISAGALISLACDFIMVAPGATIGAATPIQLGADGAEPVEEKMVSYFRTEMRTTAEAKGRRGDIAEAMVDASVFIEGIDPADKLLTLDNESALSTGIADASARDLPGVLAALGLEQAKVEDVPENWAEKLVRFLTDPVVSGLLMSLGSLGILIELYSPGLGLPGAIGVLALSLFFGGHLIVSLAGMEELILLGIGVALLGLEVFVIPGFGFAGIIGIVCVFSSLVLTTIGLPMNVLLQTGAWVEPLTRVAIAMSLTVVGLIVAARYLPRSRAMSGLVLSSTLASNVQASGPDSFVSADETRFSGQVGIAESDLRPVGVARFGDQRVDVVSEGGYVPAGSRLRVVEVEGVRIVVRAEPTHEEEV